MKTNNISPFVFSYQVEIPSDSLSFIWKKWENISDWASWDASLEKTTTESNGLELGKHLKITPIGGQNTIPVYIIAFVDGVHFTTSSSSPIGIMSIGHTLQQKAGSKLATLEHTICALPVNIEMFQENIWDNLKLGVRQSVDTLAKLAIQR